ncbi:hypothetical protein B7L70_09880 [Vulcanisaeta sp. EB80]|uniref:hypothetical protein n=1 Tax=Vulcanisaeta sp. EB80 TaxID=1650660 RepID=UPI0009C0AD38|nr:hypothetical protein [Vulcanisaeta sp. EB80]PLC65968.1 hypothetical protein B7L70_09880 [Vulcanisaeta sp. EB80]
MLNCLQIKTGLVRKKTIFVCGLDLGKIGSERALLGLGEVALIMRGRALVASENPPFGLPRKALTVVNQSDILIKAKVHREYCWDRLFLWPPNETVEMVDHLVNSGFGLVVMRLDKAPNLLKLYRKPMMDNMIRAKDILDMQVPISTLPVQVGILEIKELGRGKPFWSYAGRGCIAGRYINDALMPLGFRVV